MAEPVAAHLVQQLTEHHALALALAGEARGEPFDALVAVGQVILNRRRTGRWGPTINRVVAARKQFSCFWPYGGAKNHAYVLGLAQQLAGGIEPTDPAYRRCAKVAGLLLEGAMHDATNGATHYLTTELYASGTVKWAPGMRVTARLGAHVFGVA